MTMCESCKGTGITPYSMMKAACIICNGLGVLPDTVNPLFADYTAYEDGEYDGLTGNEAIAYETVAEGHLCSDTKSLGRIHNDFVLMVSGGSGIGISKFLVCKRCGSIQDITDYDEW